MESAELASDYLQGPLVSGMIIIMNFGGFQVSLVSVGGGGVHLDTSVELTLTIDYGEAA